MSSRAFLVQCEDCAPYEPAAVGPTAVVARAGARVKAATTVEAPTTTESTDRLWCRRGDPSAVENVGVRARRPHG